jgi:hypothetical protein
LLFVLKVQTDYYTDHSKVFFSFRKQLKNYILLCDLMHSLHYVFLFIAVVNICGAAPLYNPLILFRTFGDLNGYKRRMISTYLSELGVDRFAVLYDKSVPDAHVDHRGLRTGGTRHHVERSLKWLKSVRHAQSGRRLGVFEYTVDELRQEFPRLNEIAAPYDNHLNRFFHTASTALLKRRNYNSSNKAGGEQALQFTHVWLVEDDARFSGNSATFFFGAAMSQLVADEVDLDDPQAVGIGCTPAKQRDARFQHVNRLSIHVPIVCKRMEHVRRLSTRFIDVLHDAVVAGQHGRSEVFEPTVCANTPWCVAASFNAATWVGTSRYNMRITPAKWRQIMSTQPNRWHHAIKWTKWNG